MTNTWSVTWSALPNGFADSGRARLSLVPTLHVITDSGKLGDSPVAAWPTLVAGLRGVQLTANDASRPLDATIVSARPRQDLWDALFSAATPVDTDEPDPEVPIFAPTITALHYGPVAERVRETYAAVRDAGRVPPTHPALDVIRGLTQWSAARQGLRASAQRRLDGLLDPASLTGERINQAAALLRSEGQQAAAAALPLALVAQRLRYSGSASAAGAQPSHVANVKTVEQADFHQVIGLLRDHPALATVLGLRVDVELEPFEGQRLLRLRTTDQPPLQGPTTVTQPWSSVICEPQGRRFVMAAEPTGEIRHGMLDLRADYVLTTADLYAATQQFQALAGVLSGPEPPEDVALPPQRNTGIVLAQVDRKVKTFDRSMQRSKELAVKTQERVLFADDVTAGYRVDIAANGGAFRSVMRRRIEYTLREPGTRAPLRVSAADEGTIEGLTVAEQYDHVGVPHLLLGEEVFGWDGASLVARVPGRRVAGEPGRAPVEDDAQSLAPGYQLSIEAVAEPASLPRLRYGRVYRAQVRAVDFAGNSIEPRAGDPELVSDGVPYHRLDPVLTPTLVPRTAFTFGESRNRLVVRSDGEGGAIGPPCQRHLLPPKATQRLAETHGTLDAAFGPRASATARARALAIAVNERGHLTDPLVPDPADPTRRIPQPGINVATNDGAPSAVGTPGGTLGPGEYIVLDADAPLTPYLADPAAAGAALAGLPGRPEPAVAPFGGRRGWPDVQPALLIARAGAAATALRTGADGRGIVEVSVPPAAERTVRLSAALHRLEAFDLPEGKPRIAAANGQNAALSPPEELVVVHAVSKPLAPLAIDTASTARAKSATTAQLSGTLTCHPASTARVDVEVRWTEVVDDVTLPKLRSEDRSSTASHVDVAAGEAKLPWTAKLTLGDTRRRDVECVPIASSRYREYFAASELRTRSGTSRKTIVPNAARPEPPQIHSILPTFRWDRKELADGTYVSQRKTIGVRVLLRRPWHTTGAGELLGVVLFKSAADGAAAAGRRISELVTRFAGDPLTGDFAPGVAELEPSAVANPLAKVTGLALPEPGVDAADAARVTIVGVGVRYDEARRLWFADIDLAPSVNFNPFVRLALVRFQPESVPGCHVSRIVRGELVQLPPSRALHVLPTPDGVSLPLVVKGSQRGQCTYTATLSHRIAGGGLSVVQDLRSTAPSVELKLGPAQAGSLNELARGTFTFGGNPRERDLIVREEFTGDYLHADKTAAQTTWFELVDGPRLARMLGLP